MSETEKIQADKREGRVQDGAVHGPAGKTAAVVLAAGQGKRMKSSVQKQFLELGGRPLITYALQRFEESAVDQVVLVTGKDDLEYCQKQIVEKYGFRKVTAVVPGGKERYHSVYEGLKALAGRGISHVLIHDGARPLLTDQVIRSALDGARTYSACVIAVPVKDTIKIADEHQFAAETPKRDRLWQIQTPQAFSFPLILGAYEKLFSREEYQAGVTDDAMVVETMTDVPVRLILGDYRNIKVTTPEDMILAEAFLKASGQAEND